MDGGVLAGRLAHASNRLCGAAGRDFGGTRFGQHQVVVVLASQEVIVMTMNMLDLVKVAARKRRDAQNV